MHRPLRPPSPASALSLAGALVPGGRHDLPAGCRCRSAAGGLGGRARSHSCKPGTGRRARRARRPSPASGRFSRASKCARRATDNRRANRVAGDRAASGAGGVRWLQVMLPGRPNGSSGWIARKGTRRLVTGWHLVVSLGARRVTVYRHGRVLRRFRAVVGKPSTPTPTGSFFVEETLQMTAGEPGGPVRAWRSARARTRCRNSKAVPARSRCTAATTSAERSAPPNRTAACALPLRASTGWRGGSARASR